MADNTDTSYPQGPQRQYPEKGTINPQTQENPSKFYSHFFSKSFLVAVVLVLLPLFPSQAPEFINQTILTRSWELLHLLVVGIAVSYGLFSRRTAETEKENPSKFDTTQTYVSRILQVSSVFDDEIETPSSSGSDENKIQTWNSQYFRGNPMTLVAESLNPVLDEHEQSVVSSSTSTSSNERPKPLLLPVRSLKSQVSNPDSIKAMNELGGSSSGSLSRSGSGLKSVSSSSSSSFRKSSASGEIGGFDPLVLEEKLKESTVLPSPIPWRSRSGRMEMKEEMGGFVTPPPYSLPPSIAEPELDRVDSLSRRSAARPPSRPNSASSSPRKLSPSPSLSPEIRAKNGEDLGRKKSFYKSSPPPPPPPPPPPVYRKSPLINSSSSDFSIENDPRRSFKSELKGSSSSTKSREAAPSRMGSSGVEYLNSEAKSRTHVESNTLPMGKSVRTMRPNEPVDEVRKTRESGGGVGNERRSGNRWSEERKQVFEKVLVETDDDTDSEADYSDDDVGNHHEAEETEEIGAEDTSVNDNAGPNPNEVDKKADEFIAKFREQIRLQRIESIKRTSGKYNAVNRNAPR